MRRSGREAHGTARRIDVYGIDLEEAPRVTVPLIASTHRFATLDAASNLFDTTVAVGEFDMVLSLYSNFDLDMSHAVHWASLDQEVRPETYLPSNPQYTWDEQVATWTSQTQETNPYMERVDQALRNLHGALRFGGHMLVTQIDEVVLDLFIERALAQGFASAERIRLEPDVERLDAVSQTDSDEPHIESARFAGDAG